MELLKNILVTVFWSLAIYIMLIKIYKKQLKGKAKRIIRLITAVMTILALILTTYFLLKYINNLTELSEISKNITDFKTMKKYVDLSITAHSNMQSAFFSFILLILFPTIVFILNIISEVKERYITLLKKR